MLVVNHPEADEELERAALYYERRARGLGYDFLDEFEKTIDRILDDPERWPVIKRNARKLSFDRFPHAVIYEIHNDHIYVIAVMPLRRRPFYWIGRT